MFHKFTYKKLKTTIKKKPYIFFVNADFYDIIQYLTAYSFIHGKLKTLVSRLLTKIKYD